MYEVVQATYNFPFTFCFLFFYAGALIHAHKIIIVFSRNFQV